MFFSGFPLKLGYTGDPWVGLSVSTRIRIRAYLRVRLVSGNIARIRIRATLVCMELVLLSPKIDGTLSAPKIEF